MHSGLKSAAGLAGAVEARDPGLSEHKSSWCQCHRGWEMWVPASDHAGWGALEQLRSLSLEEWAAFLSSPMYPLCYRCLLAGSLVKEGDLTSVVCLL